MSDSLDAFARDKLAALEAKSLRRRATPSARQDGMWLERNGRRLLSFACNDYLGLAHHAAVKAAAIAAVERYGTGAGASRLVTGDHPLLSTLEGRLAKFKGAEACCVFGSGYLANLGTIPALVGPGDLIVADELSHACLWSGAKLSGATIEVFRHNDVEEAEAILARTRAQHRHALLITEGVFSMDGDRAPLDALAALCAEQDAWLMVDDAHGLGVLGAGRGTAATFGDLHVPLAMGTLSKALASYGGYVCASQPVVDLLKTRARPFIYTTGLPPAAVGAAIAALDLIEADPSLATRALANAQRFTAALGLPQAESAIVPIIVGAPRAALELAADLERDGFLVVAIRPPTVPEGTARLRVAFTAAHAPEDVDRLAVSLKRALAARGASAP